MPPTTTPTPVLYDGVIYLAHDRFVCSNLHCAGSTALHTGRTTGGAVLGAITGRDVIEWTAMGLGPARCECGRLSAVFSMRDGMRVEVASEGRRKVSDTDREGNR